VVYQKKRIFMTDEFRWVKTHCARMDHGGCSLIVGVRDDRIVKVKGDPDGFLNRGYICPKGVASPERLNHPERLRQPLRRVGKRGEGKWKKISWEEALGEISQNLLRIKERYGPKGVAFCQGMPKGMEHFVLIRLANVFGSPNVVAVQDVCHAPREITGVHTCGYYPVVDFHHRSKAVLLWGSNITSTNEEGEICSLLLEQVREGTELVVVDPRKTALAEKARLWLQLRPGTDGALALGFLNVIIEEGLYDEAFVEKWTHGFAELTRHLKNYPPERVSKLTWVRAGLIREAARFYARSHPAAIQWGNPIEQNIHSFDTARALVCLMAVCGNLDIPGGNIQANEPPVLGLGKFVRADLIPSKRKEMIHAFHRAIPRLMTVPPAYFRKAVLEGDPYPVRAAYIQCANPLLSYADSRRTFDMLLALDFLAVSDIFMTPTASMADVVLPAATHFEFNDIGHYGLGHGYILARPKLVNPPEGCWPDMKILNELGKALEPDADWPEDEQGFLEEVLKPASLSYAEFVQMGYLKGPEEYEKHLSSGFNTSTGRVELMWSQAERFGFPTLPGFAGPPEEANLEFPLILTSAKNRYYLHSSYRWVPALRKRSPKPVVQVHPETALSYGIEEGDEVFIETRIGQITQSAHLTDRVHPRVVHAAYGWWFPEGRVDAQYEWERSNYNTLTSGDLLGKAFGTPNLKGIPCRIRRRDPRPCGPTCPRKAPT
jgi:anaerobic selenocysteine-containing dehydrogenase